MRRSIRTAFVCLIIALMAYQPLAACHSCGGGGGYHYAPVSYGYYSAGCCGAYVETVVSDCCDGCSSCGSCGSHGEVMVDDANAAEAIVEPSPQVEEKVVAPHSEEPAPMPSTPSQPAETTPAPALPPR